MVIDFHTHTFPDAIAAATVQHMSDASALTLFSDGTDAGLLASMDAAGVDRSVVLPVVTNPAKTSNINDFSARCNEKRGRIFHLGGLHPDTPDLPAEATRAARLGLKGVKVHPVYQRTDFNDIRFLRLLEAAGENGLFVVMHAGLDVGFPGAEFAAVPKIEDALRQVGPVTLVLAHMGGWKQWAQAEALAGYPNVLIDAAFSYGRIQPKRGGKYTEDELPLMDEAAFLRQVRIFGARRVLFGTDSPWASQAETLSAVRGMPFTAEEKDNILYKNAQKLLAPEA